MRAKYITVFFAPLLTFGAVLGQMAVVDRVAVVVGKNVITESEVLRELRLSEFLNQQPLDLSPEKRKEAAERLVDQQLIRTEIELGHYPQATDADAEGMLRKFRQEHYTGISQFRAALPKYGITEDEMKHYLKWQLTALRFTDMRFRPLAPAPAQSANRSQAGSEPSMDHNETAAAADSSSVDKQMEDWLKETRSQTRIQFKKEAFQ